MSNKKTFFDPIVHNNPVTIQILGICSALAVTTQLKPSLVMGRNDGNCNDGNSG